MLTYKYYEVRREIYENCSDKALNKYRTLNEIKKILRKRYWVLFSLIIACIILFFVLYFTITNKLLSLIPIFIIIALGIYCETNDSKLYVPNERKKELIRHSESYNEYLAGIRSTLAKCGICKKSQLHALKAECEKHLHSHEHPYTAVQSKASDMLIGVPLGALISSIIYNNGMNIEHAILSLIIFGIAIIIFIKAHKYLRFFSDGYFKDQKLLQVLNELEYCVDE